MLEVRDLSLSYGQHRALEAVSLSVRAAEIVVILGANGAGKSSLLKTVAGFRDGAADGAVSIDGTDILGLPSHRIVEHGIALVPEGRSVFAEMSVRENLLLGAHARRARDQQRENLDRVFALFPKLAERQRQPVRTMSGGEQQMVAIGRAMMAAPRILMLDEPSLGLSPALCRELFHSLRAVRRSGPGILLVEQNAKQSLAIADRGYLLENGHIVGEGTAASLAGDAAVQRAYLGGEAAAPAPVAMPAQIAAAALRGPGPARRAGELIGADIDDLVRRAAAAASRAGAGAVRPGAGAMRPNANGAGDELAATLADIEAAARRAARRID